MRFEVLLAEDAARDLEEIHDYINEHCDPAKVVHVLERLETAIEVSPQARSAALTRRNSWFSVFVSAASHTA